MNREYGDYFDSMEIWEEGKATAEFGENSTKIGLIYFDVNDPRKATVKL